MTPLDEILIRLPVAILLVYVPFICILDLKWREIPPAIWLPLWIVNVPTVSYLYLAGFYPWYALPFSLIMCGIFRAMYSRGLIHGADVYWLWAVSLFFVVNPFPVPHGIEQFPFYVFLITTMMLTAGILLWANYRAGRRGTVVQMLSNYPGGVPLVLPISAAFLLTVVFG
jgi:hypothetical protein